MATTTENMVEEVKKVIESLLVPTPSDPFLLSRLNTELCIPLQLIAKQHSVVAITGTTGDTEHATDNLSVVEAAVKASTALTIREVTVKDKPVTMIQLPVVKPKRDTLILRDVPATATEQDVRALFEECHSIVAVKADICNTWFVTLADEQQVLDAMPKIRAKKIAGSTVRACVKSQNVKPLTTTLKPQQQSQSQSQQEQPQATPTTPQQKPADQPHQNEEQKQEQKEHPDLLPFGLPAWSPYGRFPPPGAFPSFPGQMCFPGMPDVLFDAPPPPFGRRPEPFRGRGPSSHGHHPSGATNPNATALGNSATITATQTRSGGSPSSSATAIPTTTSASITTTTTTDGGISVKRHLRRQPLQQSGAQQQIQQKKPQEVPATQGSTKFNMQFPPLGGAGNTPVYPPLSSLPSGYPNKNFKQYSKEKALRVINKTMAATPATAKTAVSVVGDCRALAQQPIAHTENTHPNASAAIANEAKQESTHVPEATPVRVVSPGTQPSYAAAARAVSPTLAN